MALPKLQTPTYELKLDTLDSPIQFRPYLVKEEKILMIASETGDEKSIIRALTQIVKSCTFDKVDVESLPVFDIEYLFLNIRAKSVGEVVKINVTCPDDKKTTVPKQININDVKVQKNENHNNVIVVNDTIKIVMKYPTLKDVANVTDYSGNNNNFTAGGGGMTLTQDNPSNNFPTMKSPGWSDHVHSYGGNRVVTSGTNYRYSVATMGVHKGKWYWEAKFQALSNYALLGITGDTGGQSNSTGHILGAGLYHYSVVYNDVGANLRVRAWGFCTHFG